MQLGGLGERCKLPQWGLGRSPSRQRIWCIFKAKNNSSRSNIFVGFAKEKIEHFTKLKQKETKDILERGEEEQQKEAQQRKCQKTIIQQEKFGD